MLSYAAPSPIVTGERLLALHRARRLRVLKGVQEVRLAEDGSRYEIQHAHGVEPAAVLVNTSGSLDRDVGSPGQPALIRGLAEQDLLRAYSRDGQAMKGAAVDMQRASGPRALATAIWPTCCSGAPASSPVPPA